MPYYIFIVSGNESSNRKSATLVTEFGTFKEAKNEVKRLRIDQPLDDGRVYKINFSASEAEAEKALTEFREQPIAREWEK